MNRSASAPRGSRFSKLGSGWSKSTATPFSATTMSPPFTPAASAGLPGSGAITSAPAGTGSPRSSASCGEISRW